VDDEMTGISCSSKKTYNIMSLMKEYTVSGGDEVGVK